MPVSGFRVVILLDTFNIVCFYDINFGGMKLLSVYFNKYFYYYLFRPTPSLCAFIATPVLFALCFGLVLVYGGLGDEISTLVAVTPMHPAIFIKICGYWEMRLSLTRSIGRSRGWRN